MLAAKDSSVFSQRIAIFLNSFIRQKKFSIRCRHLYFPRSYRLSVLRPLRGGITGSIPFCVSSLISQSASKALSANSAPKLLSLISDRTPQMSLRCPGSSMKSHKLPKEFWFLNSYCCLYKTDGATFSDDLKLIFQYTPNRFLHHVQARLFRQTVPLPI